MRAWKAVAITGAFMSVDVSITTVLYAFSHRDRGVLQDLRDFNIFDSVLDLWAACLYRSCLLLGATIGVAKNSALGPRRLRASWTFITLVCLFVGIYTMVKMLLFSEEKRSFPTTLAEPSMALSSRRAWTSSPRPWSSCASWLLAGIRGGIFTLVFARLNIRLRNCLFRSLVSQETSFFDENRTGDLISRLTSDTTMVSDLVSQNINIFLRNTVKVTGVVVFMFSLSWQLSLVTFMGFPIIMMVSDIYGKYYKRLSKEVQNALARASNTAEETISAMKTVRSFANEEEEAEVYARKLQQVYKLNRKEAMAYTYYVWGSGLTLLVVQVSILYYGGHLVISGQMTSGNLISFIIYEFVLGDCMESVGSVYSGLMQGVGAAEKVFEFIDRQPTMVHDGSLAPDHLEGRVDFENVTFTYRTRPHTQVLQNVSFTLSPGKVTALVGPSGSGKSSCVNILENFYPLEEGRVLLDGKPISSYDHKYLHRVISLVSQEPVLFARSITDNISYGLPTVPFEMVVDAAQKANAHGFIMELQDGYNTETGEKGAQLSGGQKQRVAMARALVRNPPVLILDEATSALDAESEYMIQQAIHGNLQKHTVLIIAHRLSTVEKAHNIIVLDKGRVVQQGTHKQLLTQGGLYAKLVQRQILGLEAGTDDDSGGGGGSRKEMMHFPHSYKEPPDGHGEVHKA
ncbi:ABC-type oligopeptide transporter ABCB9 isoform X2 [Dromiciops gliroides]|uniref:ABC-type oligopeptide transporter ABCB9 isoform X2 n=1 Tax=Dromiciops gliroides TaxID=33562 RepID=UPI001CC54A8A|nr:ABC-type oligopeptide transporter ABCB9 isoform X2 [Dromiciops gliroides]